MEPSQVEGLGEVNIGKSVSNHYKSDFVFFIPIFHLLFVIALIKLKNLLLLCEKFLRKPIHPPSWLGC